MHPLKMSFQHPPSLLLSYLTPKGVGVGVGAVGRGRGGGGERHFPRGEAPGLWFRTPAFFSNGLCALQPLS